VEVEQLVADGAPGGRDALFDAFRRRLAGLAGSANGVLLVLDDVQWLDRESAELLHYLVRTSDRGPLLVLLLARGGELTDNETMSRVLRSLRRERAVVEIELEPLSVEEVAALVGGQPGVDAQRIHRASAGNPLYALELARAPGFSDAVVPAVGEQLDG
jgi:predicted ATPase